MNSLLEMKYELNTRGQMKIGLDLKEKLCIIINTHT